MRNNDSRECMLASEDNGSIDGKLYILVIVAATAASIVFGLMGKVSANTGSWFLLLSGAVVYFVLMRLFEARRGEEVMQSSYGINRVVDKKQGSAWLLFVGSTFSFFSGDPLSVLVLAGQFEEILFILARLAGWILIMAGLYKYAKFHSEA